MIHAIFMGGMGGLIAALIAYCSRLNRENDRISLKLFRAEKSAENFSKQLDAALHDKQAMEAQIKGERAPCDLCDGCIHSIKFTTVDNQFSNYRSVPVYNCRKNIRCKEYEEAKPC